jgi:methionyl-tRNA formyltransferase
MTAMETRIVFMGSPAFAAPTLRHLAQAYPVVGVVTQPDRPAGRGRSPAPPPVKELAIELGLPYIQPERLREPEAFAQLQSWRPEVIVVAAYGQILRLNVLELPPFGCLNVHASLLPRWRGAAPIQAALLHGDEQTGISIMRMDRGVDTGPILSQRALEIRKDETAESLSQRLSVLGAELLVETLPGYLSGMIQPVEQDHSLATLAPMLQKEDGVLNFSQPAEALARRVRAFQPWPGTSMAWEGQPLKIHRAHTAASVVKPPGSRSVLDGLPAVHTVEGALVLDEVQPAGRKKMPGAAFLQGARNWED